MLRHRAHIARHVLTLAVLVVAATLGSAPHMGTAEAAPASSVATAGNPLAGVSLYVDPRNPASLAAASLASTDPEAAALLSRIGNTPTSVWFGDWFGTDVVAKRVDTTMTGAASTGTVPVLVLYAIPHRDCGGYSAGGLSGPSAYHDWVRQVVAGIKGRKAAVIVEPDALPKLTACLDATGQQQRLSMLRDAVTQLTAVPSLAVYLDAGQSGWNSASVMAQRLRDAGVSMARGFSLNVAHFSPTAKEETYGDQLGGLLGGRHYVVDTSRNGLGPASTWCNPPGEALGHAPTAVTTGLLADAYLWVKHPGLSDGTCNGGPPAGQWWTSYALGLAERAAT